jgi:hypothetical protein
MIESALQPGHFIAWNQENAFVEDLEGTEREIAAMVANDPQRASSLYETFIAACFLKADQIDSEWEFRRFIAELACGWIRARQAAEASAESTARTLLSWMDRDDYGFFNDLGSDAPRFWTDQAWRPSRKRRAAGLRKIAENKRINRAATLEIAGRRFSGQSMCRSTVSMNI